MNLIVYITINIIINFFGKVKNFKRLLTNDIKRYKMITNDRKRYFKIENIA